MHLLVFYRDISCAMLRRALGIRDLQRARRLPHVLFHHLLEPEVFYGVINIIIIMNSCVIRSLTSKRVMRHNAYLGNCAQYM
jgi:hypothetical protein